MKYLILIMALISAFFVSADELGSVLPTYSSKHYINCSSNNIITELVLPNGGSKESLSESCIDIMSANYECFDRGSSSDSFPTSGITSIRAYTQFLGDTRLCQLGNRDVGYIQWQVKSFPVCENPDFPEPSPATNPTSCLPKPQVEPDPDAKCDEFGNNSMLPKKAGVGSEGQNACYTNPANGLSCQYVQGGDNFIATGKECSGDENDYGDRPTPEPLPDGADPDCQNYGSQGQVLICDVDPNEGCNPLLINGETQYQCPSGCGSMDGVYFCAYDDKDGDGIPDDKNGNGVPDKDETCLNGRCKPKPPTPNEPPKPPTPETPDMTKTNDRLDGIKGELGFIGGKIDKTNKALNGINSGVEGLKKIQGEGNKALGGIEKNTQNTAKNTQALSNSFDEFAEGFGETDINSEFNPDASSSFYESEYEDGFQGVWDEKSALIKQTGFFTFLDQFKLSSGGSAPDMQICFDSTVNLGCQTLDPDWQLLMPFLKLCIFITTAFVCRRIIFGG
jgi:hypothetical protein